MDNYTVMYFVLVVLSSHFLYKIHEVIFVCTCMLFCVDIMLWVIASICK